MNHIILNLVQGTRLPLLLRLGEDVRWTGCQGQKMLHCTAESLLDAHTTFLRPKTGEDTGSAMSWDLNRKIPKHT